MTSLIINRCLQTAGSSFKPCHDAPDLVTFSFGHYVQNLGTLWAMKRVRHMPLLIRFEDIETSMGAMSTSIMPRKIVPPSIIMLHFGIG